MDFNKIYQLRDHCLKQWRIYSITGSTLAAKRFVQYKTELEALGEAMAYKKLQIYWDALRDVEGG
jgi:hypothetical protein